jgi:hypothetical protein
MAFLDHIDKMASRFDNGLQHIEAHAFPVHLYSRCVASIARWRRRFRSGASCCRMHLPQVLHGEHRNKPKIPGSFPCSVQDHHSETCSEDQSTKAVSRQPPSGTA